MNGQHFTGTGLRRHLTQRFRRQMVQRHVVLHLRQTHCRHVGAAVSDAAHYHFDVEDLPHQQIGTPGEVFDLDTDPDEMVNLWDHERFQEVKASLIEQLAELEIDVINSVPFPTSEA